MYFMFLQLLKAVKMDIKERLRQIPKAPGVYIMKDVFGSVLYIGKAASLRKRVLSYFRDSRLHDYKTTALISKVRDIDFIPTGSPEQALLLEASLIKERLPKYNVLMRDDKSYPVLTITRQDFPRVFISRPRHKSRDFYFGPYTNVSLLHSALKVIRRIFPYRSCLRFPKRPCLYYRLNLCPAPCIGLISKKDYQRRIKDIILLLEARQDALINRLITHMQGASRLKRFEEAAQLRDQIQALSLFKADGSGLKRRGALIELKDVFGLARIPRRIEAFDISNIAGTLTTGSMVSFWDGLADKDNYRRFRIKHTDKIDDCAGISEVIRRRYSRLKEEGKDLPGLIIIDGGKGQLNAVGDGLKSLRLDIPIIAIAKANEKLYIKSEKSPIILNNDSKVLHLIQHIRNEAHRFAIKYHHLLRRKKIVGQ